MPLVMSTGNEKIQATGFLVTLPGKEMDQKRIKHVRGRLLRKYSCLVVKVLAD